MKKHTIARLFSFLMSAAFLLGMLPTTAFAEGDSTALSAAGSIASGTYHLEADLNGDLTIPSGADVSIDLRGHDIRGTGAVSVITIEKDATLTLTDSSTDVTRYGRWADGVYTIDGARQEGDDVLTGGCVTGATAVPTKGGGVYNYGTFILQGGNIAGNRANVAGGVFNEGSFSMQGGTVTGNHAYGTYGSGGGVYNTNPKQKPVFTMSGTAAIRNNRATASGGGIYNVVCDITMDGGSITGNTAGIFAGGVYNSATYEGCTFTINNGNISGNAAAQYGGGIYNVSFQNGGALVLISGTTQIKNNVSGEGCLGGGIYTDSSANIRVSGTPQITGNKAGTSNNNIFLKNDSYVTVTGPLGEGSVIGVSAASNNNPLVVSGSSEYAPTAADMGKFTSDDGYSVDDTGRLVAHIHKGTLAAGQAPTCMADGWKDYYSCPCGQFFEDEACTTPIPDLDAWKTGAGKIAKLDHHTGTLVAGQDATNGADGWKDTYQCSVCGQFFEDEACTKVIPDLDAWKKGPGKLEKLGYAVTAGNQSSWQKGSEKTLTFTSNGLYDCFTGLEVDETTVPRDQYTAREGSTIITMKKDFLGSLDVGDHTITFLYQDGECSAEFTVTAAPVPEKTEPEKPAPEKPAPEEPAATAAPAAPAPAKTDAPKTGDESHTALWLLLGLASAGALAGVIAAKKHSAR